VAINHSNAGTLRERLHERTRIAQELHDNLLQSVLGISMQIEVTDELFACRASGENSRFRRRCA